ncbi:AAA family ATPase [Deinococcus aquiradiocola]|nr:AAA family ATPase [Deinococcus aquiradiocola]
MNAPLVYLIGWPAVGKWSVAQELARERGWQVVDNHLVADPIFAVIGADGVAPKPPGTGALVQRVRAAVLEAAATLAPPGVGFVFTNVLFDEPEDRETYSQVRDVAARRGAVFVPVVLQARDEALRERIVSPGRTVRRKPRSGHVLDRYRDRPPFVPTHPHTLVLDTTALSVQDAAGRVLRHVDACLEARG